MMKPTHYKFTSDYESAAAAGRVRPRWSLRNDHISLAMGMASKGQSNMNALTGPMFNELYGKFAIRVTPYTRCFNYA